MEEQIEEKIELKSIRKDITTSVSFGVDVGMEDLYDNMRAFALALGYHTNTVKEYFGE